MATKKKAKKKVAKKKVAKRKRQLTDYFSYAKLKA